MMKINDKIMAMPHCRVMMWMTVRFRPFPTFVIMLMVFIMDVPMRMVQRGMVMFEVANIFGGPNEIACCHSKYYESA